MCMCVRMCIPITTSNKTIAASAMDFACVGRTAAEVRAAAAAPAPAPAPAVAKLAGSADGEVGSGGGASGGRGGKVKASGAAGAKLVEADEAVTQHGSLVVLYENDYSLQPLVLQRGGMFNNRQGSFPHNSMIGKPFGAQVCWVGGGGGCGGCGGGVRLRCPLKLCRRPLARL